ncbi:RNA recognition motif (RRM) containing protein [Spatholobus suberectus]|nr:RNA recognition motif (RRM) containing protein [Spatholobus suberectus]
MSSFSITRKKTPFQKHREEEEAKKKRAEDETARLYAEFVESFQGDSAPGQKLLFEEERLIPMIDLKMILRVHSFGAPFWFRFQKSSWLVVFRFQKSSWLVVYFAWQVFRNWLLFVAIPAAAVNRSALEVLVSARGCFAPLWAAPPRYGAIPAL